MKFSEFPRFILEDFFSQFVIEIGPSDGSVLIGPMTTIVGEQWSSFYGIVDVEDSDGYINRVEIPFRPKNLSAEDYYDNNFFYVERMTSLETSATSAISIPAETNFYLLRRKNGVVQEYVDNLIETGSDFTNTIPMDYFINPHKIHQYIGKLYPEKEANQYRIEYWGYDRYAITCIPEHNQTPRLKEFFEITLDKVYNSVYNRSRDIKTLLDAKEIPLSYLPYLAQIYNYTFNKSYYESLFIDKVSLETRTREKRLREITSNIINYLKRKGTYSSLYIIFKNLFWTTENNINVYERWHTDSVFSLSHDYDLEPHFVDFNYLNYYDQISVGCAGTDYYTLVSGKGFNVPFENCYIHKQLIESDKWYIAHSLNDRIPAIQCLDSNLNLLIPDEIACIDDGSCMLTFNENMRGFALIAKSQYVNPVLSLTEFHTHNLNQIAPIVQGYSPTSFTYGTVTIPASGSYLFDTVMPSGTTQVLISNTSIDDGTYVIALSGDYFHTQITPSATWHIEHDLESRAIMVDFYTSQPTSAWAITHTLNSKDLVYQIYSDDLYNKEASVSNITNSVVKVNFNVPESGHILLAAADETITLASSGAWMKTYLASGGSIPLVQTYDSTYTDLDLDIRPVFANTVALSSTSVTSGYLEIKSPDYVETILYNTDVWYIEHGLESLNVIVNVYEAIKASSFLLANEYMSSNLYLQAFSNEGRLLNTVTLSASTDTITVSLSADEQIFVNSYQVDHPHATFTYTQMVPSASWWVEHYLDTYAINVRVYSGGSEIDPEEMVIYNKNWTHLTFTSPITGYVDIYLSEKNLIPSIKILQPDFSIVDENNLTVTHALSTIGYIACAVSDSECTNLYQEVPDTFQIVDQDNITVSFGTSATGLAILREVGDLTYNEGLLMSPHYKVEVDLNCEILCTNNILTKEYANMLYEGLEVSRPVSKYAHYSLLASPITDFTGNTIKMYNIGTQPADFYTYCCVDTTPASGGGYVYRKYKEDSTVWNINHGLNTENILVQCYDSLLEMMFPASVKIIDENNITVEFYSNTAGICLIGPAEETLTNTLTASASWGFTHTQETSAVLTDYYFYLDKEQLLPSNVSITAVDLETSTWYVPTLGYCQLRDRDYLHVQTASSTEWTIVHTLPHKGVIIQIYDDELNQLFPKSITLNADINQIIITLHESKSGYAFIICVGGLYSKTYIAESLADGYFLVGNGSQTDLYDARLNKQLKNALVPQQTYTTIVTEDLDRYYVKGIFNGNKESTPITEMGLFNGNDELVFYTYVKSEFYKVENFDITAFYRINK